MSAAARLILLLVAAVVAMGAGPGQPGGQPTLYVDIDSVGGACSDALPPQAVTQKTPWCTLARAFADAPAGSTVLVRRGAYPMVQVSSFAPAQTVTFAAYPGERPVLAGVSLGSRMTAWANPPSIQNLALSGFKITNPGVSLENFSGVTLSHNEIALSPVPPTNCHRGSTFDGSSCVVHTPSAIRLDVPASNLTISRNYVHDGWMGVTMHNGNPPGVGNPPASTYRGIVISGNLFRRMGGVVLQVQNFQGVVVSHNVFADDVLRGDIDPYCHCEALHVIGGGNGLLVDSNFIHGGRGVSLQPRYPNGHNCEPICLKVTGATVQNNVIAGRDFGLWVLSSPGIRILNNTIWGTEGYRDGLGLRIDGAAPATDGVVLANNLIRNLQVQSAGVTFAYEDHNDVASVAKASWLITPHGPHDISASPRFAHPKGPRWNFQLLPRSPAIRRGSSAQSPSVDILGRPRRSSPTLGAFEYLTAPPVISAPGRASARRLGRRVLIETGIRLTCSAPVTWCPARVSFAFRLPHRVRVGGRLRTRSRWVQGAHRSLLLPTRSNYPLGLTLSAHRLARLRGRGRYLTLVVRVSLTKPRPFVRRIHLRVP